MTVAEKILYILQVTNWTQEALANKLGVKQVTISKWKRGKPVREAYIVDINAMYDRARRMDWERKRANETVPDGPKVLSKCGKIILKYPYYSHQHMPWERR